MKQWADKKRRDIEFQVQPKEVQGVRQLLNGTEEVRIVWEGLPDSDKTWEEAAVINQRKGRKGNREEGESACGKQLGRMEGKHNEAVVEFGGEITDCLGGRQGVKDEIEEINRHMGQEGIKENLMSDVNHSGMVMEFGAD
ncbi:hypothetical protein L195_g003316 [Trifolium pratense]|uniref:Chromo domain-containing protein n=1 Tax=Trifolium pratense TaxID=57577 RepID=A0A2K3NUX1_TRIPR|nr:hypothetical protein L195_g003316 [Trifolium pratense]